MTWPGIAAGLLDDAILAAAILADRAYSSYS